MSWVKKIFLFFLLISPSLYSESLIEDQNSFALSLYTALSEKNACNFVICPFGIFSALSMAYIGAKGTTAEQMKAALQLSTSSQEDFLNQTKQILDSYHPPLISIANGMWVGQQTALITNFSNQIETYFQATVETVNFSETDKTRLQINSWISKKTQDKVPELLQKGDITAASRLLLVNAVYFEGDWLAPFSPNQTQAEPFYLQDHSFKSTLMMQQTGLFPYFENEFLQGLELGFMDKNKNHSEITCWILLPKKSIADLQNLLSDETLKLWNDQLKTTPVSIKIPKFCFSTRQTLNDTLIHLGMEKAFSPDANFSGIDGREDLLISNVLHECFFSFQEQGVTASAATSVNIGLKSIRQIDAIPFVANHPFLFLLIDKTNKMILLLGKLMIPQCCNNGETTHER